MDELILFHRKEGDPLRILDFIASHSTAKCNDFAHLLLRDTPTVRNLRKENISDDLFVRAVLERWIATNGDPAVPRTWESLIKIMSNADLDGVTVQNIEANVC